MVGIRSWQQRYAATKARSNANHLDHSRLKAGAISPSCFCENSLYRDECHFVKRCRFSMHLNNRGEDTYLAGKLDEWGGLHCGRADGTTTIWLHPSLKKQIGNKLQSLWRWMASSISLTEPDGSPVHLSMSSMVHTDQRICITTTVPGPTLTSMEE